jgi:hypothetical protein
MSDSDGVSWSKPLFSTFQAPDGDLYDPTARMALVKGNNGPVAIQMVSAAMQAFEAAAGRPCLCAERKGCGNVRCPKIAVRGVRCDGTARGINICKVLSITQ